MSDRTALGHVLENILDFILGTASPQGSLAPQPPAVTRISFLLSESV